ncbi:MAG: glycosyltransferase family 4 protein [candidate division WOR-3 bacterium]
MEIFLIDPRNTTKPYNFCLLSSLREKKFPFKFFGFIPNFWKDKLLIKENNLFLPISRGIFENKHLQLFIANFTQTLEMFQGYLRLKGLLKEDTILHFLWFTSPGIEHYIIPHLKRVKMIHTVHNLLPHRDYPRDLYLFKALYSQMDEIIVHDKKTEKNFYKIFDLSLPITVIPHGNVERFYETFDSTTASESEEFYFKKIGLLKRPIFLFMGPIKKYKGFENLIGSLNILNRKKLSYSVVVKDWIKEKMENLYSLNVSLHYSKLGLVYRNVDAVILPHTKISQSITLFEAGYFGKPVIVSNSGGLEEVVRDGKDGFVFNGSKYEDLADKIEKLIQAGPKELKVMGENFKEHLIKNYSWDKISEKLIKIYERILNC